MACSWLFKEGMSKLTGVIPSYNINALRYAQRVGFKREGVNRLSISVKKVWYDQTYVGLSAHDA